MRYPSAALALLSAVTACQTPPRARGQAVDGGIDARIVPGPTIGLRLLAPGWSSEAMERQGLVPAEAALRRAPALSSMEGVAVTGAGLLTLTFEPSTTLEAAQRAVQDVARGGLPGGIALELRPSPIDRRRLRFAVRSTSLSLLDVRELTERVLLARVERVPGVAEARACGGLRREATVILDVDRLAAFHVRLGDVTGALARPAPYAAAEDIAGAVVGVRAGIPVRLGDVATVHIGGARPDCWVAAADGLPRVEGTVTVSDPAALAAAGAALDAARAGLPLGVDLERLPDPTLRLIVRAPAGPRPEAVVARIAAALREVAPAATARLDRRGDALPTLPDEAEIDVASGNIGAIEAALAPLGVGPVRAPDDELRLIVAGPELDRLGAAAEGLRAAVASVPGVAAVGTVGTALDPRVDVKPDPQALARAGASPAELEELVAAATSGLSVARARDGDRDIAVVVRVPGPVDAADADAFRRLTLVPAAGGSSIPIMQLATLTLQTAPAAILRRDRERIALVWIRAGGQAGRPALRDAVWRAARSVPLPADVRLVAPKP